jgi:ABC-type polysaccharide/polyol phosphate transport system ATPase subunit
MAAVAVNRLGVRFLFDRQGRPATSGIARLRRHLTETWGLRGVDARIEAGESVALIGPNGSGKTTFLRALAGVYFADEGSARVTGRVSSLLSVDAGLLPALTGRENALLLCVLYGMSRADAAAALDEIGERSGLAGAYDRPSSSYSAGMRARLGFAAAEQSQPEVLLLDEVHEALDVEATEALLARARTVTERGGIVVAAGHDLPELGRLCDRALLFEDGSIRADGPFEETAELHSPHPVAAP